MTRSNKRAPLPIGTQVVALAEGRGPKGELFCPKGSVGVVVGPAEPANAYSIRLTDGSLAVFSRDALGIRKHFQQEAAHHNRNAEVQPDLRDFVIYRCVVGSRAFGLDEESSDYDRRGIFLPPADLQWSLFGLLEQIETHETQECYWELEKFLLLALKANPNVLECLHTPFVELASPLAEELLAMRSVFLSQLIYTTYNSYVLSQFKKLNQDIRNKGGIRWKHAMHLIRLLLSGITVLREGFVPLRVEEHRDRLLAIRRGSIPWEEINAWRLKLHKEFDATFASTRLPEYPDYDKVNAFLIRARRTMI